jgi:hemerythrin
MRGKLDIKFLTGVAWQDKQHSDVLENINNLLDAIDNGDGATEIKKFLVFLDNYVVVHFHEEEKAMSECHYPSDLARDHIHDHTAFIIVLSQYRIELELDDSPEHVKVVGYSLNSWLEEHMLGMDKKLGVYLTEMAVA